MTDLLQQLRALTFDSLTAREAVELRTALGEATRKADEWFASLARDFGQPAKVANGRPPVESPTTDLSPPARTAKKRGRGRPVPDLKVDLNVNRKRPAPLAVGGADATGEGPQPAQIFQQSYVSKSGPAPGATLPPDHPRRNLLRESSVTPEVDMADFHEVEEAVRKGQLGKVFQ
jgi:hypothetical protein